jgi:hypothetical protein
MLGGEGSRRRPRRGPRRRPGRGHIPLHSAPTCVLSSMQDLAGYLSPSILQRSAERKAVNDTSIYSHVSSLATTHTNARPSIQQSPVTRRYPTRSTTNLFLSCQVNLRETLHFLMRALIGSFRTLVASGTVRMLLRPFSCVHTLRVCSGGQEPLDLVVDLQAF